MWGPVPQRTVRAREIVILTPRFDFALNIIHQHELTDVHAAIAQATVERFYVCVFMQFPEYAKAGSVNRL